MSHWLKRNQKTLAVSDSSFFSLSFNFTSPILSLLYYALYRSGSCQPGNPRKTYTSLISASTKGRPRSKAFVNACGALRTAPTWTEIKGGGAGGKRVAKKRKRKRKESKAAFSALPIPRDGSVRGQGTVLL